MSLAPHAESKKRKKNDSKPHSQINKCLNEKRRREQENIHIEELAELLSASPSDMSSLSCKPDKCAILKETVNQIRSQKQSIESELSDDLQQSEVSSSKPNIINNQIFGSILLEALEGFLFVVNIDGKVEFVSENISSFLKFHQSLKNHKLPLRFMLTIKDDVIEKSIYDFIHPDDRARFNSNLLLMMPIGNGRDWSPENSNFNSPGKPTKHFNCRFLIQSEELKIKMENSQNPVSQYENLSLTANYIPLGGEGSDTRNGLTCIARRVAVEEKRVGLNKVEQFTTRIDREGKVVDLDISMLSPVNEQYLKKELLGAAILDFCHASDLSIFKQHLKETLENGASTCNPIKFRVNRDRYSKVKTKSKRFHYEMGEFIISTHSIIRDCDTTSTLENSRSISSPSSTSTSSGPGSVSDSSTSINGSVALSPLTGSNHSYSSFPSSTPQNNVEYDLVLDMFPGSNWPLEQQGNPQLKETELTSAPSYVPSPQAAPTSNRSSETSATASPTNSAFVPGLPSRGGSSVPSPAMQSRTPTPFGGSCYSPSASQSSSGRSSPPRALPAKADSLNCSSSETLGLNNLNQGIRQERQFDVSSNQKLRNLLTQSSDSSVSHQLSRQASQEEVTVIGESRPYEEPQHLPAVNVSQVAGVSRPKNVILRDLLNQEDDDSEAPVEPLFPGETSTVPSPHINAGACKGSESAAQQRLGNNNMLRKLLNNDDGDRNYRKSQEIIHQLLIEGSGNRISYQNENRNIQNVLNQRLASENTTPNAISVESSHGTAEVTFLAETSATKRKIDNRAPTPVKRQNSGPPHAHLAGQNPMLASMLAQTPRTPPTVPTSVASTIMTQLPQERLPKNLEKKLVHTPYTGTNAPGTATSTQAFQNILTAPRQVQRGIVTTNSQGQVVRTSLLTALNNTNTSYMQQVDKLLSLENENILARQLDLNFAPSSSASVQNSQAFIQQLVQSTSQSSSSVPNNVDLLSDVGLVDVQMTESAQTSQADPVFAEILEQIYSLQEEHNLETCGAEDRAAILKLLGEVIESPPASQSLPQQQLLPQPQPTAQDLNEKIAISAIQKELMEGAAIAISSQNPNAQVSRASTTYSQAGKSGTHVSGTSVLQTPLTAEQLLLLQQQQQQLLTTGSLPPNYNVITNRVRLPSTTHSQLINNQELLAQAQRRGLQLVRNTYVNIGNANVQNQIRKTMKQRLYLQQQQKRLLEQQQKQQLTMQTQQPLDVISSAGANSFPENMNDLLNNTVAPNVTLLRSSDLPEVPNSARFNINTSNPVPSPTNQTSPSPSQLSPGQRVNPRSPFSPLSQQSFPSQTPPPTSYQTAGLSPHPPPLYSQGGSSQSPLPLPPVSSPHMVMSPQSVNVASPQWNQRLTTSPVQQNLQLQNPMLNAQLSQQAPTVSNQQVRLTAQQRQQLILRSMANQTVQISRNSAMASQADNSFSSLSPVLLQSQANQRLQRTLSLADRIAISQSQPTLSSDSVLSPQPLSSPTFAAASISTSTIPSSPLAFSAAQNSQQFTFERQNAQGFSSSSNEITLRSPASVQVTSDLNRQEIRGVVNARNQLSLSTANQVLQSIPSGSTTRVLNVQNLSRETLEELGLSGLLSGTDAQSSSQALYSHTLLNVSSNMNNAPQPVSSPRVQAEENRPADQQKKSLLQQLLSEPT